MIRSFDKRKVLRVDYDFGRCCVKRKAREERDLHQSGAIIDVSVLPRTLLLPSTIPASHFFKSS
jgi:hypothetical protein